MGETPFLLDAIRWKARSHLLSGMCDRSKIEPTVTEK